jgi:uncharacterized protein YqgV (UPF0045/DUF77 family)
MQATIEISMYPLTEKYEENVIAFIEKVKQNNRIRVEVNGLSTQLFGDYDDLMKTLTTDIRQSLQDGKAVFIMKIGAGELSRDNLPETLK